MFLTIHKAGEITAVEQHAGADANAGECLEPDGVTDRPHGEGKEMGGFVGVQIGLGGEVEHGGRGGEGTLSGARTGDVSHG